MFSQKILHFLQNQILSRSIVEIPKGLSVREIADRFSGEIARLRGVPRLFIFKTERLRVLSWVGRQVSLSSVSLWSLLLAFSSFPIKNFISFLNTISFSALFSTSLPRLVLYYFSSNIAFSNSTCVFSFYKFNLSIYIRKLSLSLSFSASV